jgi:hypothetical protein
MSYLRYLCLFAYMCVQQILCYVFLFCLSSSCVLCYILFCVFLLCFVCLRPVSCVIYCIVFFCFVLFVFVLCLVLYIVLCFFALFCLSSSCVLCIVVLNTYCIGFSLYLACLRLVYPMLLVFVDCAFLIAPSVYSKFLHILMYCSYLNERSSSCLSIKVNYNTKLYILPHS